ncbi:fumarylacetoacetate hydrolase family protein [Variovorax sp. J31P179]|uniref:fumarylacetoacetate hydrolase family protein n=1 Tax=Variovorax sp. J31P179 TaxID=3053508 RepID=UPI0025771FF4|nr:fumarylacetoacetate hydrolase family protein [Variovorax sp. J31P179]MDM0085413.1 fumarylacetoacetate hydrolase family protein [Variovorax sp. J31P179]
MKLASLKQGGRDGTLIVVSRDLRRGVKVPHIATTLQQAIEQWESARIALDEVYQALNKSGVPNSFVIDVSELASPLPRAFQFLDGSVYLHHMEKARKARGAEMPPNYKTDPLMYQGMSDRFIGPRDAMCIPDESLGLDYEAELAVVLDDVPMGLTANEASGHIKLLMLLNDFTLRTLTRTELPKGFGFMQAKPTSSFSPVAVTPDELGDAWDGEKLDLPIRSSINGEAMGHANTGKDMFFTYPTLIAHAARTRSLSAGTIIGAGAVSNLDASTGYACLAEKRADEELSTGKATTAWLRFGDSVRIEMLDAQGNTIFGAIDNKVARG